MTDKKIEEIAKSLKEIITTFYADFKNEKAYQIWKRSEKNEA